MNLNTKPNIKEIESWIKEITYTRLPSGTAIVCEITTHSLHTFHGIAVVVDMDNDMEHVDCTTAYNKALDKMFEVLAYLMHERMDKEEIINRHRELVNKHKEENNNQPVLIS